MLFDLTLCLPTEYLDLDVGHKVRMLLYVRSWQSIALCNTYGKPLLVFSFDASWGFKDRRIASRCLL